MQLTHSNNNEVDSETSRTVQGSVMPVETITLASIGKWLIGLVLAPWLWHERKRVDALTAKMADKHYTKDETKEKIEDKLAPIQTDVRWIRETLEKKYGE